MEMIFENNCFIIIFAHWGKVRRGGVAKCHTKTLLNYHASMPYDSKFCETINTA